MSVVSAILVYLIIWMIVFFISLPIGINVSKELIPGNANSAPVKTNLKAKFFYSILIALPLTYLVILLVKNDSIVTFINSLDI
jgi:predicted secreted protein|tara:strand:+ start:863 stop:1111 length:249 start_codon:yes stop_codon:yes gene_type:complete